MIVTMSDPPPLPLMDPTTLRQRIESLDIVRGFALTGVFLVNFQSMIPWTGLEGTANGAAAWFLQYVVAGKFYRLFAFLFGVGFALQMRRFRARGAPFVPTYSRRLLVLFAIGVAHGILLWPNDILALFAQLGVLLLLIRHVSTRWLIVVGIACLFAAPTNYYVSTGFADFFTVQEQVQRTPPSHSPDLEARETQRVRSEGSYRDVVVWNTRYFLDWQTNRHTRLIMLREEFLMFLFGLHAGRRRLFERAAESAPYIRKAILGTLAVGLLMIPTIGWLTDHAANPMYGHLAVTFRQVLRAIQQAALSLTYGLTALHIVDRFCLQRLLSPIGHLGRMALTNYLLLSLLVTAAFYNYGLGLYGRVTVLGGMLMAVAAYGGLTVASSWWLRRYRFGPAEWVWRSLTYASLQPLRAIRSSEAPAAQA